MEISTQSVVSNGGRRGLVVFALVRNSNPGAGIEFFLLNLSILTKRAKVKNRKKENYFFAIFCRNKKMSLKTGRSRLHDYKFRTKKV